MLTPENAGCPKCFAPLSEQEMHLSGGVEIVGGKAVMAPREYIDAPFHCSECGFEYHEMHQRNAHDIAAYAAAQEAKKKKH